MNRTLVPEDRWIYNVADPDVTPYVVSRDDPKRVDLSVVIFPGGGSRFLASDAEGSSVATWLNYLGISAFVVKYRVSTHPDGGSALGQAEAQDAQRAMRLVRQRASEFGLSSSRVGAAGFSAGGAVVMSLLAKLADPTSSLYTRYDAADNHPSFPDFALLIYPAVDTKGLPSTFANAPPLFISIDEFDPCTGGGTPGSLELYSSLQKTGGPSSELHVFAGSRHGYGRCAHRHVVLDNGCFWTTAAAMWLQASVLKGRLPANLWAGELVNLHATNGNDQKFLKSGDQS